MAILSQRMYEMDYSNPEYGVREVTASFHRSTLSEEYRTMLVEDGEEPYTYQWETESERNDCIYAAREDGTFISDRDGSIRIFAQRDDAARACIEVLHKRIVRYQQAITRIEAKSEAQ